VTNLSS